MAAPLVCVGRGVHATASPPFPLPADGAAVPVDALWSGETSTRDPAFCEFLADLSDGAFLGELHLTFPPFSPPAVSAPGVWNLVGDRAFAREHAEAWNYLSTSSPNHALKAFERRLYLDHVGDVFDELPRGAPVLDLGGGIGRFAVEWLRKGLNVTLVDANEGSLGLALGHLAREGGTFALRHLAAEDLSHLPDATYYAISAMEVFCYLSEPARGFAEAARVLRPGGSLVLSVESPVGSLDPAERHSREAIAAVQSRTELARENDVWVRYFTETSLRAALESAGLTVERIIGTHYLTDGPMHHLVDVDRLGDPIYEDALIELERLLATSRRWAGAARALLAVARKPA